MPREPKDSARRAGGMTALAPPRPAARGPRDPWLRQPRRGTWAWGANDHDWHLVCLRHCAVNPRGVDAVLDGYAAGPDKYGDISPAPEGRLSAPSRNAADSAGRGRVVVVLVDLAPEQDGL